MGFALSVWNPHQEYDLKALESVKYKTTFTKESHHLPYEKKLANLFHENRILKTDQQAVDRSHFFQFSRDRTIDNKHPLLLFQQNGD